MLFATVKPKLAACWLHAVSASGHTAELIRQLMESIATLTEAGCKALGFSV